MIYIPKLGKNQTTINSILIKISQLTVRLLSYLLPILIIAYIFILAVFAVVKLTGALGINDYLKSYLQNYPSFLNDLQHSLGAFGDNYTIYLLTIIAGLLVGMLILIIFKDDKDLMILPFEVAATTEKYLGKAISDQIAADLRNIRSIYEEELTISSPDIERFPTYQTVTKQTGWDNVSTTDSKALNSLSELGTIGISSISLPLGQLMVVLMQMCPIRSPQRLVSGSLQNYGSEVILIAHVKHNENHSLEVHRKMESSSAKLCIVSLIREMSFKIAFKLKPEKFAVQSELGFRHLAEALEAYNRYTERGEMGDLERARISILEAANTDKKSELISYIIYGIISTPYINMGKYVEVERMFRNIILIKPDDEIANHMWGTALYRLDLFEESIECYNKALEKNEASASAWYDKGISLTKLKQSSEAIACFKKVIEIHEEDKINSKIQAFAWLWTGVAYEFCCNKSLAIDAYNKAIQINSDLTFVHSSLARLYSNLNAENYKKMFDTECNEARKEINKAKEYSRACFEAICGDRDEAFKLLWLAWEKKQVALSWLKMDPDLEPLRGDSRYLALINDFSVSKGNVKAEVSKAAIFRMLGLKYKFEDHCKRLSKSIDGESEYIRACFLAVCGKSNGYIELLRVALENNQISSDDAWVDPDFEFVREDLAFQMLLDEYRDHKRKEDTNEMPPVCNGALPASPD